MKTYYFIFLLSILWIAACSSPTKKHFPIPIKIPITKYPIPLWALNSYSIELILPANISKKRTKVLVKNIVKQLYPQIQFKERKSSIEIGVKLNDLSIIPQKKVIEKIHFHNNRLNKPYYKKQTIIVQKITCFLELIVKDNVTQAVFLRRKRNISLARPKTANNDQIKEDVLGALELHLARWLYANTKTKTLHFLYYPIESLKKAFAFLKNGDWQRALGIFNQIIERINFTSKKSLQELTILGVCYYNRAVLLKSLGNHKVAKKDFYRAKNIMQFIEKE